MPDLSISCDTLTVAFLFILLTTTPPSYSDNQTDREALLAIKKAIHDDPLGALTSWNKTMHFCKWKGISCGKRHRDRVVSVSMPSQGLVGTLSPHIGNLSFLRLINLQNNTFRGPIPEAMGHLTRLETIMFTNNSFTGGIPANLSRCKNLYTLNLNGNRLTGSIPHEIGSLANLERLSLSRNMLSGTISPFLGNITSLTRLSIENCALHGEIPESIAQLGRLQWLSLNQNSLTGEFPLGLYNLSSIEVFSFGDNRLHGSLPSDIFFKLPKLRVLDFYNNRFTGALPASLSNYSRIQIIEVSSNNFTGEMIDVRRFVSLQALFATSNHLKGDVNSVLSSLTNCSDLLMLALDNNLFTGFLPDSVGNLSSYLRFFFINENQISGSIPSSIGNLVGLSIFTASFNNLEGSLPWSIGRLHSLQEIHLESNMLTSEIPSSFGNLTLLSHLHLQRNHLIGNVPESLGNCSNLLRLDLSENNLNASLPPEIMSLSSISISLNLSHNGLTGDIPSEVGGLKNLGALDLSHNRLSGFIPSSLRSCVKLETLRLQSNSLQGEIPDSMIPLRGLKHLDLSRNNFSGIIPGFLAELPLEVLNLSFNNLHGEVPSLGVFWNESAVLLEGNRDLCGGIATRNLPPCSSTTPKKKQIWKILVISTISVAVTVCFCVVVYTRRVSRNCQTPTGVVTAPEILRLSYADLFNATGGFSETNLLGAGRFGSVYRGTFDEERTVVAVKVLNLNQNGASKSLASECNASRGIRHRNLLKILSVCDAIDYRGGDFKALVYEFMANGSLENWLHQDSEEEGRILSIIQRLNIAIDVASAVEYLHCGTDSTVIHGDLKPSNILLDEDMVAHVGDFGLARIISSISGNLSTTDGSSSSTIKGTIGYIAPEYGMNSVVSTQGDAYSYGILLLEMFTNRRPTSDALEGHVNLHDFIINVLPDRVMEAVDPFLHREIDKNGHKYQTCIISVLSIGVRCSKQLPRDRMSIAEAVNELKKIRNVLLTANNHARN